MKEKRKNRLWGPMKGEPNEQGQTDDKPNLIRETCCRSLVCLNTPRARKEGAGGGRKERERKKETKVLPATTHASRDTPKRRAPSYDEASRDTHGRGRREEREKERKREGEKGRGKEGVPSYEQSSRDTPKKERGDPEYCIQENPRKQRKNGGGKGEKGGLSARQVPMDLKLALL